MRTIRYLAIAEDLRRRIREGSYAPGQVLASEAELARRYSAGRVTVRRALDVLRREGLVDSRRGFGWFVATDPVPQQLGRLGTIEADLAARGRRPVRRVLEAVTTDPPPRVARVLGPGPVTRVRRLNLADDVPFARVTVWCPAHLVSGRTPEDFATRTFQELVGVPLGRATQVVTAAAADAEDAGLLGLQPGAPVLRCWRTTYGTDGRPVLFAEHVFPGHLTELVVEIPRVAPSMGPDGLRLSDGSGEPPGAPQT